MSLDEPDAATRPPLSLRQLTGGSEHDSTDHKVIEDYGLGRKLMLGKIWAD